MEPIFWQEDCLTMIGASLVFIRNFSCRSLLVEDLPLRLLLCMAKCEATGSILSHSILVVVGPKCENTCLLRLRRTLKNSRCLKSIWSPSLQCAYNHTMGLACKTPEFNLKYFLLIFGALAPAASCLTNIHFNFTSCDPLCCLVLAVGLLS